MLNFFFTLMVSTGAWRLRVSVNRELKVKSLSSTSSKISTKCQGAQLRSSLKVEQLKILNDRLVTVLCLKDGVDQSTDSRIGKWSEMEQLRTVAREMGRSGEQRK